MHAKKAKVFIFASILTAAASVLFLIRAESRRHAEEAEFNRSVSFTVYSSHNNQKFVEDYIGYVLLWLAPAAFIYGVWLTKAAQVDSSSE